MRKNLKPSPSITPMPVLIIGSYDENGTPDAMNAAWGTACDSTQLCIFIAKSHKTFKNIMLKKEFTVSLADAKNVIPADYVGIVSGNDVPDKLKNTSWTAVKSENIDAPLFAELPYTFECHLNSFNEETEAVIADIVNISADESILGEDGKVDLNKFAPIAYIPLNGKYMTLGDIVGSAFKDGLQLK